MALKETISDIPKWLTPMFIIIFFLGLFVIWKFSLVIHWKDNFHITQQVDVTKFTKYCPKPESITKHGFCIWHEKGDSYDKTYIEAAEACKAKGARLCSLAEVSAAQATGAEWCSAGWVSDPVNGKPSLGKIAYPMQIPRPSCGDSALVPNGNHPKTTSFGANCCR